MKTKNDTISAYVSCVKSRQTVVIKQAYTAVLESHTSEVQCLHEAGLSTGSEPVQEACDALFTETCGLFQSMGAGREEFQSISRDQDYIYIYLEMTTALNNSGQLMQEWRSGVFPPVGMVLYPIRTGHCGLVKVVYLFRFILCSPYLITRIDYKVMTEH